MTDKETAGLAHSFIAEVIIIGLLIGIYVWAGFEPYVVFVLLLILLNQLRGVSP